MNQLFAFFFAVLSAVISSGETNASSFQDYANERLHRYAVAGASIVVIDNGNQTEQFIVNNKAVNLSSHVESETIFQAASISKSLTAWIALTLVQDGLISLDEPIQPHLRRWRLPKSLYDGSSISLRQLLSHTAGLSVAAYTGLIGDGDLPGIEASLNGRISKTPPLKLVTQPGQRWAYSGGGYTLIQLLIEELSGLSFSDYAEKKTIYPFADA